MNTLRRYTLLVVMGIIAPLMADNYVDDAYYWKAKPTKQTGTTTQVNKAQQVAKSASQQTQQQTEIRIEQKSDTVVKAVINRKYEFGY